MCDTLSYLWAYSDPGSSFLKFSPHSHLWEIHLDESTFPLDFSLEAISLRDFGLLPTSG